MQARSRQADLVDQAAATPLDGDRQPTLGMVLRRVLDSLASGAVVATSPAELRLALRLESALAAFDVASRVLLADVDEAAPTRP